MFLPSSFSKIVIKLKISPFQLIQLTLKNTTKSFSALQLNKEKTRRVNFNDHRNLDLILIENIKIKDR